MTHLEAAMLSLDAAVEAGEVDIFAWHDLKRQMRALPRPPKLTRALKRHRDVVDRIPADGKFPIKHIPTGRR
jgi:hypothetical protein